MGKHKHKSTKNKFKSSHKKKHKALKYETRIEALLSTFPDAVLDVWYKDDEEERQKFGSWLIDQEEYIDKEYCLDILNNTDEIRKKYRKKIKRLKRKECRSIESLLLNTFDLVELEKKAKKAINKGSRKHMSRIDMGIATFMNSKKYRKECLNTDDYRKYLKKAAKSDLREMRELVELGYIRSIDPDEELKRIERANSIMSEALSDSYIQKHFIS